jgi:hypothetical protein
MKTKLYRLMAYLFRPHLCPKTGASRSGGYLRKTVSPALLWQSHNPYFRFGYTCDNTKASQLRINLIYSSKLAVYHLESGLQLPVSKTGLTLYCFSSFGPTSYDL